MRGPGSVARHAALPGTYGRSLTVPGRAPRPAPVNGPST